MESSTTEAMQQQDEADIQSERIRDIYRRSGHNVPREPSSQDLAHRFVRTALDAAGHMPGINDRAQAALGLIQTKLAIAGENNNWIRDWLARETKRLDDQLRLKEHTE